MEIFNEYVNICIYELKINPRRNLNIVVNNINEEVYILYQLIDVM